VLMIVSKHSLKKMSSNLAALHQWSLSLISMEQSAWDDAAIDPVPIADEVMRSLIPGKCLRYSTSNPFRRQVCWKVDPDEVPAVKTEHG
jgi:hypothetical protein